MSALKSKDFAAGILFLALGSGAAFVSAQYDIGSLSAFGPGLVPMVTAALILLLGVVLVVRTVLAGGGEGIETVRVLPVVWIVLSAVIFGLTIEPLGLVCAITLMTLVAVLGGERRSVAQWALLTAGLCVIAYLIFVVGLAVPVKVWPV